MVELLPEALKVPTGPAPVPPDSAPPLRQPPASMQGGSGGGGAGTQLAVPGCPQTAASYMSKPVSVSSELSLPAVAKKTSLPLSLASSKIDSFRSRPEEIREMQPSALSAKVSLVSEQTVLPPGPWVPAGSYW